MTARAELAAALKPLLPKGWRLIPYQDALDDLDTTVVMLKLSKVEKAPASPLGAYLSSFTVTVVSPTLDPEKAEDELDDAVLELLADLDGINNSLWSSAEKVLFQDQYLAWDVAVQVVTNRTKE